MDTAFEVCLRGEDVGGWDRAFVDDCEGRFLFEGGGCGVSENAVHAFGDEHIGV